MIKTEAKVGIFVFISLILLFYMTLKISGVKKINGEGKTYFIEFTNVSGLVKKAKVEIAGVDSGWVENITLTSDGKAKVEIKINPKIKIYDNAKAYVKSYGFMGEKYVELHPGNNGKLLQEGEIIKNSYSEKSISEVADEISVAVNEFSKFMKNLNTSMGTVEGNKIKNIVNNFDNFSYNLSMFTANLNNLFSKNRDKIQNMLDNFNLISITLNKSIKNIAEISEKINKGEGTLGKLINDKSLYTNLDKSFQNLKLISDKIATGKGTIGKFINDEEFYNEIKGTIIGLKKVTELLTEGKGTFGRLLVDDSVYKDLKITLSNLNSITSKINSGQGTLGKVVSEEEIYNDIRKTLIRIQRAADGISEQTPISTFGTIMGTLF